MVDYVHRIFLTDTRETAMYINERTQKQLTKFDAFIQLMGDLGMTFEGYADETKENKLGEIRSSIIEKRFRGCGHADAYFKHPSSNVWLHIECETPTYTMDQSKVRVLVSEGRSYYGSSDNPYRPLGRAATLKARIEDLVSTLAEREDSASRKGKFFAVNKPAAEKMIQQLTGEIPVVSEDKKGFQQVSICYRGVSVDVGLSSLIKEGTALEVTVSVGFNAARASHSSRVTLEKWVSTVDQLHGLGLLGK